MTFLTHLQGKAPCKPDTSTFFSQEGFVSIGSINSILAPESCLVISGVRLENVMLTQLSDDTEAAYSLSSTGQVNSFPELELWSQPSWRLLQARLALPPTTTNPHEAKTRSQISAEVQGSPRHHVSPKMSVRETESRAGLAGCAGPTL